MWRPMTEADLPTVMQIGDVVHADLPESLEVVAERLRLFPAGCWVAPGGYILSHPARRGVAPRLNRLLRALPADADTLHLHDVAFLPERQGQGGGRSAMQLAFDVAARHGLPTVALVSVHGTGPYWGRFGFVAELADVASYGDGAMYMTR
jgi:GNAT superfamily N-acetyltransferase